VRQAVDKLQIPNTELHHDWVSFRLKWVNVRGELPQITLDLTGQILPVKSTVIRGSTWGRVRARRMAREEGWRGVPCKILYIVYATNHSPPLCLTYIQVWDECRCLRDPHFVSVLKTDRHSAELAFFELRDVCFPFSRNASLLAVDFRGRHANLECSADKLRMSFFTAAGNCLLPFYNLCTRVSWAFYSTQNLYCSTLLSYGAFTAFTTPFTQTVSRIKDKKKSRLWHLKNVNSAKWDFEKKSP